MPSLFDIFYPVAKRTAWRRWFGSGATAEAQSAVGAAAGLRRGSGAIPPIPMGSAVHDGDGQRPTPYFEDVTCAPSPQGVDEGNAAFWGICSARDLSRAG